MTDEIRKQTVREFIDRTADYIETHENYDALTKREVVVSALEVLTGDLGAAQNFMNAIGIDINLYAYAFNEPGTPNNLHQDLRAVLNKHSVENGANIPDSILATYLIESLKVLNTAVRRRDRFFGISVFPATDGPIRGNEERMDCNCFHAPERHNPDCTLGFGLEPGVVVIDEAAEGTEE